MKIFQFLLVFRENVAADALIKLNPERANFIKKERYFRVIADSKPKAIRKIYNSLDVYFDCIDSKPCFYVPSLVLVEDSDCINIEDLIK